MLLHVDCVRDARPPRSPLFPYTTLFRSIKPVADEVTLALNGRATGKEDEPIALNIRPTSSDPSETFNITISDIPVGADRKSTRLNSSHVRISYAVFCLKKKMRWVATAVD